MPLMVVAYGCDLDEAWTIVRSGFNESHFTSNGLFGKGLIFISSHAPLLLTVPPLGLYVSTSLKHLVPRFGHVSKPAVLVCFAWMGQVYPVTEDPTDPSQSLRGKPATVGYQSNYALVDNSNILIKKPATFDGTAPPHHPSSSSSQVAFSLSPVVPSFVFSSHHPSFSFDAISRYALLTSHHTSSVLTSSITLSRHIILRLVSSVTH